MEIIAPNGGTVHVRGINISRAGMQLLTDRRSAQLVAGDQIRQGVAGGPFDCRVRFPLVWPGHERTMVEVDSRVAFVRRESESEYMIGVHYSRFEGDGEALVDAYVEWRIGQPHLFG